MNQNVVTMTSTTPNCGKDVCSCSGKGCGYSPGNAKEVWSKWVCP